MAGVVAQPVDGGGGGDAARVVHPAPTATGVDIASAGAEGWQVLMDEIKVRRGCGLVFVGTGEAAGHPRVQPNRLVMCCSIFFAATE